MKYFLLALVLLSSVLAGGTEVFAQRNWQIMKLEPSTVAKIIVPEKRTRAKDGLPDGLVATAPTNATIVRAWYSEPTQRYNHGILGDSIEAGSLVVVTKSGEVLRYSLPKTQVFEDITPRLVDLDGDGTTEVITILSSVMQGAAIGIFHVRNGKLQLAGQTKFIGLSHRWLNIAGIERYVGNKAPEIAIVVTPHIGGRLDLFQYSGGKLYRLITEHGFSNHFIGSREQRLSASYRNKNGTMNLALPSADRRHLMIMGAGATGWIQIGIAALPARIDKAIAVLGKGDSVKFTVGLDNGSVYSVFK